MVKAKLSEQEALIGNILWLSDLNRDGLQGIFSAEGKGKRYYYINNPDGSIRWFFPASNASPVFLALYNSASAKALIYRQAMHLAFAVRQQRRLVSGEFHLSIDEAAPLEALVQSLGCQEYACFTGTAGANRKSVIACGPASSPRYFIKLAHTPQAVTLVQREKHMLDALSQTSWKYLVHPRPQNDTHEQMVILDNIRPRQSKATARHTAVHINALEELGREKKPAPLGDLAWYQQVQEELRFLKDPRNMDNDLDQDQVARVVGLLLSVNNRFSPDTQIDTALSHGDFTPWNSYLAKDKVHVYDWELAEHQFPALYDYFHFHLQSGCLLRRKPFSKLALELKTLSRTAEATVLLRGLEENRYFQLYLLITVSRYLRIYAREKTVLTQAHWLLSTWENALISCL